MTHSHGMLPLILTTLLVAGCGDSRPPEESLRQDITDMIGALETKQYRTFIDSYCDPETVAMWKRGGGIDAFERQIAEKLGARLLSELKKARAVKPDMGKTGVDAMIFHAEGSMPLIFKKIGSTWRLLGKSGDLAR